MALTYFPSEAAAQVEWFSDSANQDFSNFNSQSRKENLLQFQKLIVAVTGMSSVENLEKLCQDFLYKTPLWKSGTGCVSLAQRTSLRNIICSAIDQRYSQPRVEGYSAWMNKAILSLVQIEITAAKRRDKAFHRQQKLNAVADQQLRFSNPTVGGATNDGSVKRESEAAPTQQLVPGSEPAINGLRNIVQTLLQQRERDRNEFMGAVTRQNQQIQQLRRNFGEKDRKRTKYGTHRSNSLSQSQDTPSSTEGSLVPGLPVRVLIFYLTMHPEKVSTRSKPTEISMKSGIEKLSFSQSPYETMQMPSVITNLKPMEILRGTKNVEFTFKFLSHVLGGIFTSNGRYYIPPVFKEYSFSCELRCYRILSPDHESLLPRQPGQHGAQISFAIPDHVEDTTPFPLFVRQAGGNFRYFGNYREPRAPDKLSGIEMLQVPASLKKHWAEHLSSPLIVKKIRQIFGSVMESESTITSIEDCSHHRIEHGDNISSQETEPDPTWMQNILLAFDRSDFASEPSLRLFYEYLEFLHYDDQFYQELTSLQTHMEVKS